MRNWHYWSAELCLVVFGSLMATSSCGSNPSSPPQSSAGAPATNGNAGTANAGSSAAGVKDREVTAKLDGEGITKYSACVEYTKAQCKRRMDDCGERDRNEDPCAWSLDRCPDLFFSPGATWTVESLLSCAEEWKEFPCEDVREHKRPSCAMPQGTRKLDEPCLFANQCESNTCTEVKKDGTGVSGYTNCKVCGETSEQGGTCDMYGYECGLEYTCVSRKCVKKAPIGEIGAECDDSSSCGGYGVSCRTDPSDGVKRCLVFPVTDESCADTNCADGYLCTEDKICAEGPGEGELCATSPTGLCAAGLVCTGRFEDPPSTCIGGRQLGESCTNVPRLAPRGNCEKGLRCDCGKLDCDVASGICREPRAEGESCDDENSMCVPGTMCVDGICSALEGQPALIELCPL